MAQPVGWHRTETGQPAYWDGSRWIFHAEAASPSVPISRKRRNNVLPGILIVLGAAALGVSTFLPWIEISGPSLGVSVKGVVNAGVQPSWSFGADSEEGARPFMVACAVAIALAGLALMVTRRRGLGVLWRFTALLAAAIPGLGLVYVWQAATSSASNLVDSSQQDFGSTVARFLDSVAQALGVYKVAPASGLFLWTAGIVVLLLGCFVPAGRRTERVD